MAGKKKKKLTTEEKFANAEKILKGKKLNPNGKELFDNVLRIAVKNKK
jgi:hypothetical protein